MNHCQTLILNLISRTRLDSKTVLNPGVWIASEEASGLVFEKRKIRILGLTLLKHLIQEEADFRLMAVNHISGSLTKFL